MAFGACVRKVVMSISLDDYIFFTADCPIVTLEPYDAIKSLLVAVPVMVALSVAFLKRAPFYVGDFCCKIPFLASIFYRSKRALFKYS